MSNTKKTTTQITLKTVLSQAKEAWAAESRQLNSLELIKYLFEIRLIKLAEGVNLDKKQFHLYIYSNVFGIRGDLKDHPQAKNISLRVRACDYLVSVNRDQIMSAKPTLATLGADIDRLAARAFKGIKKASDIYKLMSNKSTKTPAPVATTDEAPAPVATDEAKAPAPVATDEAATPVVDPSSEIRTLYASLLTDDKNAALQLLGEAIVATYQAFARSGAQKSPKLRKIMVVSQKLDTLAKKSKIQAEKSA